MNNMAKPQVRKSLYVRVGPGARRALKRVLGELESSFGLERLTQEDLVAASWELMAAMDPGELAEALRPHVATVRAEEQSPESPPPRVVVTLKQRPPRGRAGKRGGGHTDGEEVGGGGSAGAGGGRGVG